MVDLIMEMNMYTVKRMGPQEIISQVEIQGGVTLTIQTRNRISWAVIMPNGGIAKSPNTQLMIYSQKGTAQKEADCLNSRGKIIPKTDPESQKIWDSIAEVAKEVEAWPQWKKGA